VCKQLALVYGELPPHLKDSEKFVCSVYCSAGPTTLCVKMGTALRILPHITHANYIATRDKSYTENFPALSLIEGTWMK